MARLHHLAPLCVLLFLLPVAFADFDLSDLNDDSYTRQQGDPAKCPGKIRFRTEDAVIASDRIQIEEKTDCDDGVTIGLTPVAGAVGPAASAAASAPVRYFASRIVDVRTFFRGRNNANLVCGPITFPRNTEWVFIEPEEELDDVKWTDVFSGQSPDLAKQGDAEVDFDDDERYLLVGDICFYKDSSFISDNVCFPADVSVQLEDGSHKTMDKLSIGDRVHVGNGIFSDIFAWTHQDASKKYKFVQLATENGDALTATASHYVYADGKSMQMKHVRVGMSLLRNDGSATTVVKKTSVVKTGLYNPQTLHGDIVVDGFVATTYTTAVQPEAAHALLAPIRAAFQAVRSLLPVTETSA